MHELTHLLQLSASRHSHLCPRQVLGVRIAVAALNALGLEVPLKKGAGLVLAETDGCFVDGIEVATGATVGQRTLRIVDLGKIAATFVDVKGDRALRVAPRNDVRTLALIYAPRQQRPYDAQLEGYRTMPEEILLHHQKVRLHPPITALLSRAGTRVNCDACGEEIINERQVARGGMTLCRACAGDGYYEMEALDLAAQPLAIPELHWA